MFLNCKQAAYEVTFLTYKKETFFHFYPTDLVNTKTTIPLRVGEQRWIYTSTLRILVYISATIHLPFAG